MKSILVLICTSLFAGSLSAQTINKAISGQVKNIQNEAVYGATVRLLKTNDSIPLQTKTTRENGRFEFSNLSNDTFRLQITAAGNKEYSSTGLVIDIDHPAIILPVIILLPGKKTDLKEVVVTTKKPFIEQDIDKTVVNPDALISSATSNTLEVLEKTPGITISTEGEINLNGSSVLVLIDGRPTYMAGSNLAAYLRSVPGSMLDKIELMTNPPSKYDAAGSAVINIKLKRNKNQGYTGNISLNFSQGLRSQSYNSLNLNYLTKKINVFGNFGYSRNSNDVEDIYQRKFYTDNNQQDLAVDLFTHSVYGSNDYSGRAGMDYTLSDKTIIGFIATLGMRPRKDQVDYLSNSYSSNGSLDSIGTGVSNGDFTWKNSGLNLNMQHKLNNTGREITADLNYIDYSNDGDQALRNFLEAPPGTQKDQYGFRYILPSDIHIYTGKLDYAHPLKNKLNLSGGIKSSLVNNDNNSGYYNVVNNTNTPDYGKSNHFKYRENINAAYFNGRKDWKRWGMQVGFRIENTQTKGQQLGNAVVGSTSFSRNYTDLFPSAFISYKLDSQSRHIVNLNYSRRLNRPNYQQLNPFLFFRDQYSYTAGNPLLTPTYDHRIELGYRYKQLLGISMLYERRYDAVSDATEAIDNIFVTRPLNLAGGHMLGAFANLNLSLLKWWSINLNAAVAEFVNKGQIYTETLDLRMNAFRFNIQCQFKFNNDWSAEINGYYTSKILMWQQIRQPRYRINAAAQKKLLKGKGSMKISLDDIFRTWKTEATTVSIKNVEAYSINQQDTRRIGISFNLAIGKETFARKRKYSDNTADDVKERVQ